jgi:hypothetical protein
MDDNRGVMLALALLLFWIAGVSFFVAFHPGGITKDNGDSAQNPVDVLKFLLAKEGSGGGQQSDPNESLT